MDMKVELKKVKVPSLGASLNFGKTRLFGSKVVQTTLSRVAAEPAVGEGESLELSNPDYPENGGEGGRRTHGALRHSAFRVRCDRPLCHLSGAGTGKRRAGGRKRKPKKRVPSLCSM